MKKLSLIILFMITSTQILGNVVTMEVIPNRPVVGETFQLVFKVRTDGSDEPYISFDRGTADVIGKSNQGVSINTTIINGKFSTTRTLTHIYELVATRSGPLRISNIRIDVGGKEYRAKSKTISVLREAIKAKDFFLQAEPSKTEVYVGEGVDVRYYLYTKVPIVSQEVKVFPKLKNFIKRFHMINRERTTTVEYMGEVYKKSLKYSARVYPEKVGNLYIDSLKLRVQYSGSSRSSPFGAFGLRMREYRTRSIQSKKIEIKVIQIPSVNVPADFTGLVGDHDFSFRLNKEKFLVNEVIEARLEVVGPGALENYAAPSVYVHKNLEEFDAKSEFSEVSKVIAKKVFDYTFLARDSFNINKREISFSMFDPNTKSFITKKISITPLSAQGGIVKPNSGGHTEESKVITNKKMGGGSLIGLVAPSFIQKFEIKRVSVIKNINYVLMLIIFILVTVPSARLVHKKFKKSILQIEILKIKNEGLSYHNLFSLLSQIPNGEIEQSVLDRIDESALSAEATKYFKDNLDRCEKGDFSNSDNEAKKEMVEMKFFIELIQIISEKRIENNKIT